MQQMQSDTAAITWSSVTRGLWPHQLADVDFMQAHPRCILADVMGLGKTRTTIAALRGQDIRSVLVVAPTSAHSTWAPYAPLFEQFRIITYQGLFKLSGPNEHWGCIIFDESHNLRNRSTKAFEKAARLTSRFLYLLTGTPMIRSAQDFWTQLHLIDPDEFRSYWRFVNKYCWVMDNGFGKDVQGVRNPEGLRDLLAAYMVRHTVRDVLGDLNEPGLIRQRVVLHPTSKQLRLIKALEADLIAQLDNASVIVPNQISALTAIRQLLITPILMGFEDDGALLPALEAEMPYDEPCAIFTPYKAAARYLADWLTMGGREVYVITGDLDAKARATMEQAFAIACSQPTGPERRPPIWIGTIATATSYSLPVQCRVALFAGYDWTPVANEQAEARVFRPVRGDKGRLAKYFVHKGTVDEHVLEILDGKLTAVNAILKHYKPEVK